MAIDKHELAVSQEQSKVKNTPKLKPNSAIRTVDKHEHIVSQEQARVKTTPTMEPINAIRTVEYVYATEKDCFLLGKKKENENSLTPLQYRNHDESQLSDSLSEVEVVISFDFLSSDDEDDVTSRSSTSSDNSHIIGSNPFDSSDVSIHYNHRYGLISIPFRRFVW